MNRQNKNKNYFKIDEVYKNKKFFVMPQELFNDERYEKLSTGAKVLYMLLLDRTRLSAHNHFFDKFKRVYIFFTREEAAQKLNVTVRTVYNNFKELVAADLIEEVNQGKNLAKKIYVKFPEKSEVDENKTQQKKKKKKTMLQKRQQQLKNLNTSIKIKKEVLQKYEQKICKSKAENRLKSDLYRLSPETINSVKEQIEYDYFKENMDVFSMSLDFLDSTVYAIAEMKTSLNTKVGDVYYDNKDVLNILDNLDSCTFMDFCAYFQRNTQKEEYTLSPTQNKIIRRNKLAKIHNLKAYLKSCLINYLENLSFLDFSLIDMKTCRIT